MTRRALVVDDEPDIREIAVLALEAVAGWQVVTATDGHQALDVAVRERPEVVLLDVTMPGMDGPETARRLAADPRTAHIPVVLLTAKVMSRERAALADVPVAAVLGKPFDPMTLAVQVAEAVGWAPPVS